MVQAKDVNPENFQVEDVLMDDSEFSVAVGVWQKTERRLAMRWNGDGDDPGYPKLFRHPVWFVLPEKLTMPTLKALLDVDGDGVKAGSVLAEIGNILGTDSERTKRIHLDE